MAWRQQGSTGSNNIPLGNKRRFGGAGDSASPQHDGNGYQGSGGSSDGGFKRGRSPIRCKLTHSRGRKILLSILQLKTHPAMALGDARKETVGATPRTIKLLDSWDFQLPSWRT
jgi:hypothetical protein